MSRSPVFAACLLIARLSMSPLSAEELPLGSPLPLPTGDWVVRTPIVLADVTITLRGDLIIERGGMLDLRGVRIEMNGETDGERQIEVRDGGSLFARRSPLTGSATVFARGQAAGRYSFRVLSRAGFLLDGAEIRDAGWDAEHPGLVIERDTVGRSGEVLVFDTEFHDNFVGLTMSGSSDAVLASRFFDNLFAGLALHDSPATLALLEIRSQPTGVLLGTGSDASLRGLVVESNDLGLLARDSSPELGSSLFVANAAHARFEGSSAADVHDNAFLFAFDTAVSAARGALPTLAHNDFAQNSFGLRNESGAAYSVDAENNYWGAADGPAGAGPGAGDPVSEEVAFTPWCTQSCIRMQPE